ncbi:MAG: DUF2922 domain-containing protein [Clostridia bacterium]|jgi:hypothetical protein|nr:DUF2922 domain-containing protein [Clostridia bacterium]
MEYSLQMTFVNISGDKVSFTISNIKPDVTEAEVNAAMDAIIAENIFFSEGGDLQAKYSAQLIQRQVTKWDLA